MTNRVEIDEVALEEVAGGQIQYTWDNSTGSGTIWVTAKNPTVYTFRKYSAIKFVTEKQNEGYSDYEIMDLLKEKGVI
ncbi:MAG: hypothetical protein HUJ53_05125 [Holdemanella sp.]|nr:hypothetical protein [Holdemanella sp.]